MNVLSYMLGLGKVRTTICIGIANPLTLGLPIFFRTVSQILRFQYTTMWLDV